MATIKLGGVTGALGSVVQGSGEIQALAKKLQAEYSASQSANQEGVFDAAIDAAIKSGISGAQAGDVVSSVLSKAAGAAGGAAICAATGAGAALAPICSAAGSWAAEKIAPVVSKIVDAVKDNLFAHGKAIPDGDPRLGIYVPNKVALKEKHDAILAMMANAGDEPEALALIKELADQIAPLDYIENFSSDEKVFKMPLGGGYARLYAFPPYIIDRDDFARIVDPPADVLGSLDPVQSKGSFFFTFTGGESEKWVDNTIDSFVHPYVKAGLPVLWIKGAIKASGIPKDASGKPDYWKLTDKLRAMLVPELDKWVQNRVKWIFEEAAIRRNISAARSAAMLNSKIRETYPDWSEKEKENAVSTVVRVVKSGDNALVQQVAQKLESGKADPKDITTTRKEHEPEKENAYGKRSKGGALFGIAALGLLAFLASRKLGSSWDGKATKRPETPMKKA